MTNGPDLGWIASYIWGIADDVLRDVYVRGKYRDVILPMTVLRRLDAVLEPTKQAVLDMKAALDSIGVVNQKTALRRASGEAFYNTSEFSLKDLRARASRQRLTADFETASTDSPPTSRTSSTTSSSRNQISAASRASSSARLCPGCRTHGTTRRP